MKRSYVRAFSTLGCPSATLEEVFSLARRYGIEAIELRALGGSVDLPGYLSSLGLTPATLAATVARSGNRIVGWGTNLRLVTGSADDRRNFLRCVPWAEALGAPLRVFDGAKRGDAEEIARALATVEWWETLRANEGWKTHLLLEAHDGLIDGAALRRFGEAAPGVPILWDTHHTWRNSGEHPVETWRIASDYIRHLHVRDSIHQSNANDPFRLVLPGAGEFPMAELLHEMNGRFQGIISLEWEKYWRPSLPPLEEALQAAENNQWW